MSNLYADTLLNLGFVPREVYNDITSYYHNLSCEYSENHFFIIWQLIHYTSGATRVWSTSHDRYPKFGFRAYVDWFLVTSSCLICAEAF